MVANSKIEWTDMTFNPWIGCTRISPACDGCYAAMSTPARAMAIEWGPGKPRHRTSPSTWAQPLAWNRKAERLGIRYRVFCASLADVLDNEVPEEWRADLFALIEATPHLDWLLLTKRIGNADKMLRAVTNRRVMERNVWLGATVVNQEEADRDIPKLLVVQAAKRFLSMEPLLGPVDLTSVRGTHWTANVLDRSQRWRRSDTGLPMDCETYDRWVEGTAGYAAGVVDWVITGGESGPHARPTNPQWFRDIRDQCAAAGVAYLHKQNGEWVSVSEVEGFAGNEIFEFPDGRCVRRIGKRLAGRTLDWVTHDGFPRAG